MIEKVKEGLKYCSVLHNCTGCPYKHTEGEEPCACMTALHIDALKVLDGETDWTPGITNPTFPEGTTGYKSMTLLVVVKYEHGGGYSVRPLYWARTTVRGKWVERWETDNGIFHGEVIAWKPLPKVPEVLCK